VGRLAGAAAETAGDRVLMQGLEARALGVETRPAYDGSFARLGRRVRPFRHFALVFGVFVWTAWLVSVVGGRGALDLAGNVKGADFIEFYAAGRIVASGAIERLYDFTLQEQVEHAVTAPAQWSGFHSFIYPPFLAFLFVPWAALPYPAAYLLWVALGVICLGAALRCGGGVVSAELPWALAFVPVWAAVSYGQNSLLSLAIFAATYALLTRGREFAAGLVLGALLYKPQLLAVPLLLLLLERRWHVIAGAATTAVGLVGAAWLVSPPALASYVELARRLPALTVARDPTWKVHSWFGFFALLLPGYATLAAVLGALFAAGTLLLARFVQPPWGLEGLPRWFAAALWGTVLANPHLMLYDLSLLVLAAVLLPRGLLSDDRALGALAAIWLAAAFSQPAALALRGAVGVSVQLSVPVIALAGYWLLREPWPAERHVAHPSR
jgi:alpha-1,2-mannosyltransferase